MTRRTYLLIGLLALTIIVSVAATFLVPEPTLPPAKRLVLRTKKTINPNFWNKTRADIKKRIDAARTLSHEERQELKKLERLGYLSGYRKKAAAERVTIHDKFKASKGFNLYVSGYRETAIYKKEILLMDMEGSLLHSWHPVLDPQLMNTNWRRVHLYPNGDLLLIVENAVLIKLDRDSNILWVSRGKPHHDIFVDKNGDIYVLKYRTIQAPEGGGMTVDDNLICILNSDGKEKLCVSLFDYIVRSTNFKLNEKIKNKHGDIFHANAIEVLDGSQEHRSSAFRSGNILVSIRNLHTVCIIDLKKKDIVWSLSDLWSYQHQPTMLENGNMLVFDNNPSPKDEKGVNDFAYFLRSYSSLTDSVEENSFSRVVEIDPFSEQIIWEYRGSAEHPFYSFVLGSAQRLPNGNTLITESTAGRAFEVTKEKEIVWEFINPDTAGERDDLIATLNEMIRIPPDALGDWCCGETD